MNYKKGDLEKYQLQIKRQVKLGNMSKAKAVVAILNYASVMFMPPRVWTNLPKKNAFLNFDVVMLLVEKTKSEFKVTMSE